MFLDLSGNRYFCLSPAAERAFKSLLADDLAPDDVDTLRSLNVLVDDTTATMPMSCDLREGPNASLLEIVGGGAPSYRLLARASIALLHAEAALRILSFDEIILKLQSRKSRTTPHPDPERLAQETVRAFDTVSRWVSPRDRCLSRSIAVANLLLSDGVLVDVVIGVVSRPFRAHCWVERSGAVLNDRLENVRIYTPILAV